MRQKGQGKKENQGEGRERRTESRNVRDEMQTAGQSRQCPTSP